MTTVLNGKIENVSSENLKVYNQQNLAIEVEKGTQFVKFSGDVGLNSHPKTPVSDALKLASRFKVKGAGDSAQIEVYNEGGTKALTTIEVDSSGDVVVSGDVKAKNGKSIASMTQEISDLKADLKEAREFILKQLLEVPVYVSMPGDKNKDYDDLKFYGVGNLKEKTIQLFSPSKISFSLKVRDYLVWHNLHFTNDQHRIGFVIYPEDRTFREAMWKHNVCKMEKVFKFGQNRKIDASFAGKTDVIPAGTYKLAIFAGTPYDLDEDSAEGTGTYGIEVLGDFKLTK